MELYGFRIPKAAALIFWAAAWEVIGQFELLLLFPPLSEVIMALGDVVLTPSFAAAAQITVLSYLAGLALAIVLGIALGMLMGLVKAADQLLNMWVNIFLSAPLSALVPVIMILFGMGMPTVVVTVFMFAVWIIALDTRAGCSARVAVADGDVTRLRCIALASLSHHSSVGHAGDPGRYSPRRHPWREGRRDRAASWCRSSVWGHSSRSIPRTS